MATQQNRNMAQVGRDVLAMTVAEAIAAAALPPRMVERFQGEADAMYARLEARAAAWPVAMYGEPKRAAQEASADAMREHYLYCAALGALNHANVDAARYIGQTNEQIAADVVARASTRRRGAGARAVARKYGADAARNITGHTVRQ